MPIPKYIITCTHRIVIARDVYELRFTKPKDWTFKSGQFVLLDIPLVDNPADIQTRAYSLASEPSEDELLFVVKLKPGGRSSTWIERTLRVGTEVSMQGPFGNFVLPETSERSFLFLATSAGIAPFRAQIRELLKRDDTHRIDLVFGMHAEEDIFWRDIFEDLARTHERFSLHITLTTPQASWTGHTGRIQVHVPLLFPDVAERTVYVCGNPAMTKDVKALALEKWGVSKRELHVEGYI